DRGHVGGGGGRVFVEYLDHGGNEVDRGHTVTGDGLQEGGRGEPGEDDGTPTAQPQREHEHATGVDQARCVQHRVVTGGRDEVEQHVATDPGVGGLGVLGRLQRAGGSGGEEREDHILGIDLDLGQCRRSLLGPFQQGGFITEGGFQTDEPHL